MSISPTVVWRGPYWLSSDFLLKEPKKEAPSKAAAAGPEAWAGGTDWLDKNLDVQILQAYLARPVIEPRLENMAKCGIILLLKLRNILCEGGMLTLLQKEEPYRASDFYALGKDQSRNEKIRWVIHWSLKSWVTVRS